LGTKFRLSPKIDAQLSQRTEGKNRDEQYLKTRQSSKKQEKKNAKAKGVELPKEDEQEEPATSIEAEPPPVSEQSPTSRQVPYVDLPPKRMAAVTVPVNQSQPKADLTYKNRAPVEMGLDIEKLVDSVMEMEVTVPLKSLAGVSGAIQKEIRKQVTKARIPMEDRQRVETKLTETKPKIYLQDLKVESTVIEKDISDELLSGYIVGSDPVLQFVSQETGEEMPCLKVGKMTEPLRSIYTKINGVGQEECVLDGGSMIVSMNKKVAVQLGLVWDPGVRIDMESASNHVEQTLGVAHNVSFEVGGLKLFLQVHILENPPYRVLLGKPFERLGAITMQTSEDGSAEIVIKDPNTKRIAVVPTYRRGEAPEDLQKTKYQDF
jgi:hypothetical protein